MGTSFETLCGEVDKPQKLVGSGSFWRKDAPVMDAEGKIVKGGMWDHQRSWWDLPNFIKVLVGGYGAGKTNPGCKRMISLALTNAPCPVATVSPTYPIARTTVILTIATLLQGKQTLLGSAFYWKYNRSSHEFKLRYKGREGLITCYSGEDPLALRGPNLAAAWIDEPFIQDRAVFDQMIARIRHPDAAHLELGITGTPEQLNWGYDLCEGDLRESNDVGVVHASTRKNLALSPDYVSRLESVMDERTALAYIESKFINLSKGLVYPSFDPSENVTPLEMPEGAELGCGMDFNVNPMALMLFWRAGDHIHFFQEYELENADTEYACEFLREKHPECAEVYPDATGSARKTAAPGGKTDFYYIEEAGYTVNAHSENPKRRDRYNVINGKLKARNGKVGLTISPDCKRLIKYLRTYTHELMNKQKAMSHLLDAFGYPVCYLFPTIPDVAHVHRLRGY